jgi:hypothetical protein
MTVRALGLGRLLLAVLTFVWFTGCRSSDTIADDEAGRRVFIDVPVPPGYAVDTVDEKNDSITYKCPLSQKVVVDDLRRFYMDALPKQGWSDVHAVATAANQLVEGKKPGLLLFVCLTMKHSAAPETEQIAQSVGIDLDAESARLLSVERRVVNSWHD